MCSAKDHGDVSYTGSGGVRGVGDCTRLVSDPERPPRDLRTTNRQDSAGTAAVAASSISRIKKINFFCPQYVSHCSLWTSSERKDTQTAACLCHFCEASVSYGRLARLAHRKKLLGRLAGALRLGCAQLPTKSHPLPTLLQRGWLVPPCNPTTCSTAEVRHSHTPSTRHT